MIGCAAKFGDSLETLGKRKYLLITKLNILVIIAWEWKWWQMGADQSYGPSRKKIIEDTQGDGANSLRRVVGATKSLRESQVVAISDS